MNENSFAMKKEVVARVDELSETLIDVSHALHAQPELGYEEYFAHELLTNVINEEGLAITRSAFGLDTAFSAIAGNEGPLVAVLCEYDALPEIGHACGHNIIAAAGLGAGLAAALVANKAKGRVVILGTPAEEGGGGKIKMIEAGAFDEIDAAVMIHPADADMASLYSLAVQQLKVTYIGQAAHAAAAPEKGVNALDAAVLGYVNVAALRQHISPDERLHGIFIDAGEKANVVPEKASAVWYARSPSLEGLERLKIRLLRALNAGAEAAGCEFEYEWVEPLYEDVVDNEVLLKSYIANAATVGREVEESPRDPLIASTDLGNVSRVVPSIHPMIKVAPFGTPIHTREFARAAISPEGDDAVLDAAKTLAMTIVDCWTDPTVLDTARIAFQKNEVRETYA